MKDNMTAGDVFKAIASKFGDRQRYAVLEQVADATGGSCSSWVDAMVLSLWPSDGLWRAAFEIKVSRGDFLREIQRPEKNEWARACSTYFWYVAPKGVIADLDEVPAGCGYMECQNGGRLVTRKQAPPNKAAVVSASLVSALGRAVQQAFGRQVEEAKREALAQPELQHNAMCRRAIGEFLEKRGVSAYLGDASSTEAIVARLMTAADSEQERIARAKLEQTLQDLQVALEPMVDRLLAAACLALDEIRDRGYGYSEEVLEAAASRYTKKAAERARRIRASRETAMRAAVEVEGR